MEVRDYLQSGSGLPSDWLIGDSIIKHVRFQGVKVCWPGADIHTICQLAEMVVLAPSARMIIFHMGTNNIPRYRPWEREFHSDLDPHDGSIKTWGTRGIIDQLRGGIEGFFDRFEGLPKATVFFSALLPRHSEKPAPQFCKAYGPGGRRSRSNNAVLGINQAVREGLHPRLRILDHPQLLNPFLFEKDGIHLNARGSLTLEGNIQQIQKSARQDRTKVTSFS